MNGLNTQLRSKKSTLLTTWLGAALFSTASLAETQFRLQSNTDTAAFSEGYTLSVEDWSAQTKASQALTARSHTNSHFWHHSKDRSQVWIRDIGTLLFDDFDGDGYHSGFSISIDVDSEYGDTEVYAKIYLQSDSEPLALLHTTSRFSVYGSTFGDEYRVDTELRNNFASAEYDVVVDIHDAWSDELLDTANARGFDNLNDLPLESSDQHNPSSDDDHRHEIESSSADVVVTEYAGAFHPAWLLALVGGWIARRRRN